ncbi:MAG: HAD hydrolase-like protein [Candidatus Woesearchaeota archaeon]
MVALNSEKTKKIKIVVFDLGGVLFEYATLKAAKVLSEKYNYKKKIILNLLQSKKSRALREGKISDKDFWNYAKKIVPKNYYTKIIKKVWDGCSEINRKVFKIVKELSKNKKVKLMIFSGNVRTRIKALDKKYNFRRYFYKEVYSFNHKINKPKTKFVRIMIEQAGVNPEEILYIEDNPVYAEPARKLGVNVVIFKNAKQLKKELKNFGLWI